MSNWLSFMTRMRGDAQKEELARTFGLAFTLASRTGRAVRVAILPSTTQALRPRVMPGSHLGLPLNVPGPEGMLDPRWSCEPRTLMVSPWATATEGMWFLRDAKGPLCMHLKAKGELQFLRYRAHLKAWQEV